MKLKRISFLVVALTMVLSLYSATYYASPTGNGDGSTAERAGNLTTMLSKLKAGDTLYLLAGQYDLTKTSISKNITGTSSQPILICNAPGVEPRTPILDFRTQAYGERGLQLNQGNDYFHIKGLTLRYSGKNALYNEGSNNIFENIDVYGNGDTGVQMKNGGNNQIINVDSHDNFDYQLDKSGNLTAVDFGGNADGFADKQYTGAANTYIGCRSWNNSDDGWDFFQRVTSGSTPTKIIGCICYKNGPAEYNMQNHARYNTDKTWFDQFKSPKQVIDADGNAITVSLEHYPNLGNGNGFKVGGYYTNNMVRLEQCLAVDNTVKGFDQNNNFGAMTLYNCSAYMNGIDYGFHNNEGGTLTIRNCLSYRSKSVNVFNCNTVITDHNSWNIASINVSDQDFISLDTTLILSARDGEGNLPTVAFMRLQADSKLIDAGVDVGLAYTGNAPDLGCYEYGIDNIIMPATLNLISGSMNQAVRLGATLTSITLKWGGSAEDVNYTQLPDGVSANKDYENKTITISGTPLAVGTYDITITTIGETESKSLTITLIVKPAGQGYSVAYITIPDDNRDGLILNRLNRDPWLDITVCDASERINVADYDFIIISPAPASTAAGLDALKTIDKPTLLLKPFMLKNTVWNWGNAQNTSERTIKVTNPEHYIFTGINLENNNTLTLFNKVETNGVTCINGWYNADVNEIAIPQNVAGQTIVEAKAGTNMNGTIINADFIMIGISEYSTLYLTDVATQLIDNCCRYMLGLEIDQVLTNTESIMPQTDNIIYTITGMPIGKDTDIINNLPSGIYIMNGKKIVR